ncbi:hypothetical protein FRC09_019833, partial [Ceratobasidium sp. 395]
TLSHKLWFPQHITGPSISGRIMRKPALLITRIICLAELLGGQIEKKGLRKEMCDGTGPKVIAKATQAAIPWIGRRIAGKLAKGE